MIPLDPDALADAWSRLREALRESVPETTWHLWLEPLELAGAEDGTLVLRATPQARGYVAERFGRLLQVVAASVLGEDVDVDVVGAEAGPQPAAARAGRPGRRPRTTATAEAARHEAPGEEPLNPRCTFDQFVIGEANRFAHAAALAVAEMPGLAYNPLFLCGPPGVGKTHLLQSIGNYLRAYGDGLVVRYATGETFTNEFVGAIGARTTEAFKRRYRTPDVLLVDDVQFLEAKARTEEEFFHTFDALHQAGSQLVLGSDRPPRDMQALEDRLRERFEAGLVCDLRPPDLDMRVAILRKRVLQDGLAGVDASALELLATRITENVRALEGALIRVVAFASLTGRPVDAGLCNEVLETLYPGSAGRRASTAPGVRDIQERTAEAFGISCEELLSKTRTARVAEARQVAMYLVRELTGQTLPQIGRAFGGRNHTTVLHAHRRTAERMSTDPATSALVRRLTDDLTRS